MRCWRTFLQRDVSRYLDGELAPSSVVRFEAHLLNCGPCRALLARLRDGQRLARQIPNPAPARDRWDAIEASLEAQQARPMPQKAFRRLAPQRLGPVILITMAASILVLLLMLASRDAFVGDPVVLSGIDPAAFRDVAISDIPSNTAPHVVTEGYVSELRVKPDGDLIFKLVEDLRRPDLFIVCEIIRPIRVAPPEIGSRIRVYGVSRYDGHPGRNWYEVHPVLNIEEVRR